MRQSKYHFGEPPDDKSRAASDEPKAREPVGKAGVLVADDEHMVRTLLQLGLEREGFEVFLARNNQETIDLYRRHVDEIAVVLLDIRMPDLDGLQTLESLRQLNPHVRACFMSGENVACEPEDLLKRGAEYVITKPFHLDHLATILRQMTSRVPADLPPAAGICQD